MQKDVHFYLTYALSRKAGISYLTYALSRKAGISARDSKIIAWANQYTDELTKADLYGIQTQSDVLGNWGDRQVQLSVLVPFHFIPGNDRTHPWKATRNNSRARHLVGSALSKQNPLLFGIALHGLQDTFSHEGFSGWREDLNSCYPWYYIQSGIPNVGHAELMVTPDVVNYVWTDPRDGRRIDNKVRALRAAKATYDFLVRYSDSRIAPVEWKKLKTTLQRIFRLNSYDKRVTKLCKFSTDNKIDYKAVDKQLGKTHKSDFVKAASNHLAVAIDLFSDLPWVA
ncbi:MAG: DUF6765 family protein [Planctomycetota bacterium]|jgi:hypothetical protein